MDRLRWPFCCRFLESFPTTLQKSKSACLLKCNYNCFLIFQKKSKNLTDRRRRQSHTEDGPHYLIHDDRRSALLLCVHVESNSCSCGQQAPYVKLEVAHGMRDRPCLLGTLILAKNLTHFTSDLGLTISQPWCMILTSASVETYKLMRNTQHQTYLAISVPQESVDHPKRSVQIHYTPQVKHRPIYGAEGTETIWAIVSCAIIILRGNGEQ